MDEKVWDKCVTRGVEVEIAVKAFPGYLVVEDVGGSNIG